MRQGLLYAVTTVLLIGVIFTYMMLHAFDPEYDRAEIKQKIGGVLICRSVSNADQHSWQYDVNYKYKDSLGRIFEIGDGHILKENGKRTNS
jgi:hypothetical protein